MPIYTVLVTVEVTEDSEARAYRLIKRALSSNGRYAEYSDIRYIDAEVTETRDETDSQEE